MGDSHFSKCTDAWFWWLLRRLAVLTYTKRYLGSSLHLRLPTQANSSQVHNFDGVGYRLATHLACVGLNLIKLKFSPNSCQVFHRLATLANSRQVVLSLLCDYAVVFRQLNGFLQAGSTWWYRLATRRCKFWFWNLARVGSSWEDRLARALGDGRPPIDDFCERSPKTNFQSNFPKT